MNTAQLPRWAIGKATITSVAIFAVGIWQLRRHAPYWPSGDGQPLSFVSTVEYVGLTLLYGSIAGIIIGLFFTGFARLAGRSSWRTWRLGYFIGLDIVAIVMLWLIPPMS